MGNALNNSFNLSVIDNYYYVEEDDNNNGLNIDLLEFNSVYGISAIFMTMTTTYLWVIVGKFDLTKISMTGLQLPLVGWVLLKTISLVLMS